MSYGPRAVYSVDLASGATKTTSYADLGRSWKKVYLEVPTMASGDLYILGSSDASTFRRVCIDNANTSTAHSDFIIKSSVTQRMVPVPVQGFQYVKVESSSGATDVTTTFKFICSD